MKYLRKFNEGVDEDVEYLEMMLAELGEYDFMDLIYIKSHVNNIEEGDNNILIKIKKNEFTNGYVDIQLVIDKVNQALTQLKNYEIESIDLAVEGYSWKLFKNLTSAKRELTRRQGYTGSDKLSNLNNYIDNYLYETNKYRLIEIELTPKKPSFLSKIKKFF
jgi:hypothetical protein